MGGQWLLFLLLFNFYLDRWMRIDACSYYLLSEKKQSMFSAQGGRISLSLLLFFNHHHPFFLFSSLLSHAYSRSSCVRIRLVDDNDDDGGGIFLPSLHTSRGKRGRGKKRIGGRRWWTMFSSFSIGQPYYKFFLLTDTRSTR